MSCRVFRLDLAGTAYEFQSGRVNLHQSLLVKPNGGQSGVPLTRCDWYRSDDSPAWTLAKQDNEASNVGGAYST